MGMKDRLLKELGAGLATGRERIRVDDLIAAYPEGITITGMDLLPVSGEDRTYSIFTFAENEQLYFSGGGDIPKLGEIFLSEYEGDLTGINEELQANPIRIRIRKVKTKRGTLYTKVEALK